jgi:ApaG protein
MKGLHGSRCTTNGVEVVVVPVYLPGESEPQASRFVFGYRITITNHRKEIVQLLRRHWVIKDADGVRRDVEGAGVVGRTPILEPEESFEYSSGCPLDTPWGTMEGTYTFRTVSAAEMDTLDEGVTEDESLDVEDERADSSERNEFEVKVARFYLVSAQAAMGR